MAIKDMEAKLAQLGMVGDEVRVEKKDASGEVIKFTWAADGPLGLTLDSHVIGMINATNNSKTTHLIGTVISEINGEPAPNTSEADLVAKIQVDIQ